MTDDIYSRLGEVDMCFVIDTTASMGPYIDDAKRHAKEEAERIAGDGDLDVRFAIVEYRDHPPQDSSFAFYMHEFMDLHHFQDEIQTLEAYGGGDIAEAVYDGLYHAAGLQWRPNADKSVILIGDAPPHGEDKTKWHPSDGFPDGCPCGLTARGIIEVYSMQRITLNAAVIGGNKLAERVFGEMADACRGKLFTIDATAPEMTTGAMSSTLWATSETVTGTRIVAAAYRSHPGATVKHIAGLTGLSADAVSASVSYAVGRGYDITVSGDAIVVDSTGVKSKPGESAPFPEDVSKESAEGG